MAQMAVSETRAKPLNRSIWSALLLLGFAGQLAWAVENQFFNTFMYSEITPDPRPISWMVSVTALVSTLTAIFMGALSDRTRSRWGRRKPYLIGGYVVWGVFTALFPASALFKTVALGVFMAILLDSLMTFFGSTANDAAFNAYVTDVTTLENRGRVTGALEIMKWLSILIVYGGAGLLIDALGYPVFFYLIGGLVFFVGVLTAPMIEDDSPVDKPSCSYWQQIVETFRIENIKTHADFFLVMLAVTLFTLAQQIFFPYLLIYLINYVHLETLQYSILVAAAIIIGGIAMAYPFGLLVDRWGRQPVAMLAVVFEAGGLILFSISKSYTALLLTGILWLAPAAAWTIATLTWTKDLFPVQKRGQFAGYYVLFAVAFSMIPGPLIGGWIGSHFGIPTILDGKAGFIPTPLIFQVAGFATLLAILPLWFIRRRSKRQSVHDVV
jgi:MFS family permease